jgi:hypothetical protein
MENYQAWLVSLHMSLSIERLVLGPIGGVQKASTGKLLIHLLGSKYS